MTERMNQPRRQYETKIINGREVRVEVPASAPAYNPSPVTETFEAVTPLAPVAAEVKPAAPAPEIRTIVTIQAELDKARELRALLTERFGEEPEEIIPIIKGLEKELKIRETRNQTLAQKASIVELSAGELAEYESEKVALAQEFQERQAALEQKRLAAEESAREKLAKIEREDQLINEFFNKLPAMPTHQPRVSLLSENVAYADEPTMMFDKPLVEEPKVTAEAEPKVAAEATEESIGHTMAVDATELAKPEESVDTDAEADDFTFARPATAFTGEFINPLDGQKFAEHGRIHKAFERIGALPRRTRVVGGIAIAAIAVAVGAPLTVNHFTNESSPATQEQGDTTNSKLAAELLGACSVENSFDNVLLSQKYDAAAGLVWTAQNGAVQADGKIHKIGPNDARDTSMIKITNGEIDVTMCDDDKTPAVTVDGTTIKVNLDNATMLAKVTDGGEKGSTKYKQPDLSSLAPASDGSMSAEDIAEFKANSVDTTLLGSAQKQILSNISETLKTNQALTQNAATQQAKDHTEDFVKQQLATLGEKTDYKIKVTGNTKSFQAVTPVKSVDNKKVFIDKVDVTIAK